MDAPTERRQIEILLRISDALDVVGDVSVSVANPSELLAWANILTNTRIVLWRAKDSHHRFVQVSAVHHKSPIHGNVTAVLRGDEHREFWDNLVAGGELTPGTDHEVSLTDIVKAWDATPVAAPSTD